MVLARQLFLSILGGTVTKTSGSVNVWGFNLDKNPRKLKLQ